MNLEEDNDSLRFRLEVCDYLRDKLLSCREMLDSNLRYREGIALGAEILAEKRWLAAGWPTSYGGANLSPTQLLILEEELATANFPPRDHIALDLAGPVIYTFGTVDQKRRYLPRIVAGEELWCQGFSESESGSDINSLRTSATPRGNHYVVEGRKLWTSNAHVADMMFALVKVKTNNRLDHGLTFLLIDMHQPGVTVRPLLTIDGRHHFNEVLLDNVNVPMTNVVGDIGKGWRNARFLLSRERVLLAKIPKTRQKLTKLKQRIILSSDDLLSCGGKTSFIARLNEIEIELMALEYAVLRILTARDDQPISGGLICAVKLRGAELRQRISELETEAMGHKGIVIRYENTGANSSDPSIDSSQDVATAADYLFELSATIAGGTSEIQRNIISAMTLEL
jgi:alkylation response protein AidB-like acyl-CoA dehydrogenase